MSCDSSGLQYIRQHHKFDNQLLKSNKRTTKISLFTPMSLQNIFIAFFFRLLSTYRCVVSCFSRWTISLVKNQNVELNLTVCQRFLLFFVIFLQNRQPFFKVAYLWSHKLLFLCKLYGNGCFISFRYITDLHINIGYID